MALRGPWPGVCIYEITSKSVQDPPQKHVSTFKFVCCLFAQVLSVNIFLLYSADSAIPSV